MIHLPAYKRRFYADLHELEENYNMFTLQKRHTKLYLFISEPKMPGLPKDVEFIITENYPFTPPNINIRSIPYIQIAHYCHLPRIIKYMKKLQNADCFHCGFITDNWSPAMHLIHIIYEIQKINRLKRNVGYALGLERSNLPQDIILYVIAFIDG